MAPTNECVAGLLPVIVPFQRSCGINQHVGDILDVANLPLPLVSLPGEDCRPHSLNWLDRTTAPGRAGARKPDVSVQFSPLMSWTMQLPGQVRSAGTTSPTPLPDLVGAKHSTCLVHRAQDNVARNGRGSRCPSRRGRWHRISSWFAQRAEPEVTAVSASRARYTDIANATMMEMIPPDAATHAPSTNTRRCIGVRAYHHQKKGRRKIDGNACASSTRVTKLRLIAEPLTPSTALGRSAAVVSQHIDESRARTI